jgi:hypothetical protein
MEDGLKRLLISDKLERLLTERLSSMVKYLWVRLGTYHHKVHYSQILDQDGKAWKGQKSLAYLASSSLMKKKVL